MLNPVHLAIAACGHEIPALELRPLQAPVRDSVDVPVASRQFGVTQLRH